MGPWPWNIWKVSDSETTQSQNICQSQAFGPHESPFGVVLLHLPSGVKTVKDKEHGRVKKAPARARANF